jgi:hypothetical protein
MTGDRPRFPRRVTPLSADLRNQISSQLADGQFCSLCGGIHAGLSLPACPRVASFEMDADGQLRSAHFWADGEYDASGVYYARDAEEGDDGA